MLVSLQGNDGGIHGRYMKRPVGALGLYHPIVPEMKL